MTSVAATTAPDLAANLDFGVGRVLQLMKQAFYFFGALDDVSHTEEAVVLVSALRSPESVVSDIAFDCQPTPQEQAFSTCGSVHIVVDFAEDLMIDVVAIDVKFYDRFAR